MELLDQTNEPEVIQDLNKIELKRKRRIWKPFMEKYNIKSVCEVGVFESQTFRRMLEGNPEIAVGVDAWINDGNVGHNDSLFTQERLDQQCDLFKSLMMQHPSVRLYRMMSYEAAQNFPDNYFDLVYIDADHTYEGAKKDLEAWWSKVKPGKLFTGDDYLNRTAPNSGVKFEVIKAVDEFAAKLGLPVHRLTSHGWCIIKPDVV